MLHPSQGDDHYLKPSSGTLCVRTEYTLGGRLIHPRAPCTHRPELRIKPETIEDTNRRTSENKSREGKIMIVQIVYIFGTA